MRMKKMGGKASRDKGRNNEYAARDYFRDLGYTSNRVPSSGAAQGFKGDIIINTGSKELLAEVKSRRDEFKRIYALFDQCGSRPMCVTSNGVSCLISNDFGHLGFTGPSSSEVNLVVTEAMKDARTIKKIMGMQKLVKTCDFLMIRINYKPFLFLRYV